MKLIPLLVAFFAGTSGLAQIPINKSETVSIGGIQQYITMKGKDGSLPLLLFLHGGPGGSVMHYSDKFTRRLQEHFIVVQWDQRETGKTLILNPTNVPLSLEIFQRDTHALIDTLLKRFNREKLYLMAHSWGTALGFDIARKHPELLYAYLSIGSMINQRESERTALSLMKEAAVRKGDHKQSEELAHVDVPFKDGGQLYYHRKWLLDFSGSRKPLSRSYVENWANTWLQVFNEASRENLIESLPAIGCPVYFFAGRKDFQTNSTLAERYFTMLTAPKKDFFWFENSGHSIPSSDPARLQEIVIEKILPETFTIHKPAALISTQ